MNKRLDIQALRAVAIIFVVLFHVWPSFLPNGFFGVDIFFVISGYIMSMLCDSSEKINFIDFYLRRFKRIIPIYLLIIFTIYWLGRYLLYIADQESHHFYSIYSLMLTSNYNFFTKKGYFVQQSDVNIFLHTWSLCVELQFYLFVPILFSIISIFKLKTKTFLLFMATIIFLYLYINSDKDIAFGNLLYRVWQFLFGILGFFVGKISSNYDTKKIIKDDYLTWGLLILILFVAIYHNINVMVGRISVTLLTLVLLIVGERYENRYFSNSVFVHIGDISYTLYLTHWPLTVLYRYYSIRSGLDFQSIFIQYLLTLLKVYQGTFINLDGLIVIIMSYSFSVIIYRYIEKPIIQSKLNIFILCLSTLILYFLSYVIIYRTPSLPLFYNASKYEKSNYILQISRDFSGHLHYLDPNYLGQENYSKLLKKYPVLSSTNKKRICNKNGYKFPKPNDALCEKKGNGSISVMVFGNSIANSYFDAIEFALRDHYSTIWLYTDNEVENFTKSIVISDEPIEYDFHITYELAKRLWMGLPLDNLKKDKNDHIKQKYYTRKRLSTIKCQKCIWLKWIDNICQNETCWAYDTDFNLPFYIDNKGHLNKIAVSKLYPYTESVLKLAIKQIEK